MVLIHTSIIQKNDIANLNLLLQDEVYLIKENLRKMSGEETWLTCHDHLWLEEDSNRFALKEKNITKNKNVVIKYGKAYLTEPFSASYIWAWGRQ